MKWGGGNADFQLLATLDLKDLGIVGVRPAHGAFDIAQAGILVPGHPERSLLAYRMAKLGLGRMPHVASLVVGLTFASFGTGSLQCIAITLIGLAPRKGGCPARR